MDLPKQSSITQRNSFIIVELSGYELSTTFLDTEGQYQYGIIVSDSKTILEVKKESGVYFAVIDASDDNWAEGFKSACRYDCDFYVIENATAQTQLIIEDKITQNGVPVVLCIFL